MSRNVPDGFRISVIDPAMTSCSVPFKLRRLPAYLLSNCPRQTVECGSCGSYAQSFTVSYTRPEEI
jgi:hypothetical protein